MAGWDRKLPTLLDRRVLVGGQQIGSAAYQVYRYVFWKTDTDPAKLGSYKYLYKEDADAEIAPRPPHLFRCTEEVAPPYQLSGSCRIIAGYDQIFGNLLFLSIGENATKIPVDRFPDFVLDIQRVLETADITDRMGAFTPQLPRLDK